MKSVRSVIRTSMGWKTLTSVVNVALMNEIQRRFWPTMFPSSNVMAVVMIVIEEDTNERC